MFESNDRSMFNFKKKKKNHQTVLQSAYTIFHLHQPYIKIVVPLHPCKYLVFLILNILMCVLVFYHGFHLCCLNDCLKFLFTHLFFIHTSSLLKYPRLLSFFIVSLLSFEISLYIFSIQILYTLQIHPLQIFSVSTGLVFKFSLTVSFKDDTVRFFEN